MNPGDFLVGGTLQQENLCRNKGAGGGEGKMDTEE
jgi:hypothetical protein